MIGTLYLEANIEKVFKQIDEVNQILAGRGSRFLDDYNYSRYFNSTDDDKTDIRYETPGTGDGEREFLTKSTCLWK